MLNMQFQSTLTILAFKHKNSATNRSRFDEYIILNKIGLLIYPTPQLNTKYIHGTRVNQYIELAPSLVSKPIDRYEHINNPTLYMIQSRMTNTTQSPLHFQDQNN